MAEFNPQRISEPQKKTLNDFSGGFSVEKPPSKLNDNQFASVVNLQFFKNSLRVDTGFGLFRQRLTNGDIPQAQFQFLFTDGAVQTLLLSTKFLYLDNGVAWTLIGDGVFAATLSAETVAGSNVFNLTAVGNLAVGQTIGIGLSDTSQLQTTVTSIVGTVVTTAASVPGTLNAPAGAAVIRPYQFNGTLNFQPVGVTWPNTNTFYFTNGVDPIFTYNGQVTSAATGWAGIVARGLATFHEFLLVYDTTEDGTRFPQRIRNSDFNNPNVSNSGLAGSIDLTDTEDFILAMETLGPWMIIYRDASIMRRSYIGDPLELFFDEYMITGIGVFSTNSIADTGSTHVFAGPDGIFRYAGGYDLEDVGGPVFDYLIGPQGIMNLGQSFMVCCFYVSELDEVWLMVPTGSNTWLDTLLRLNQEFNAWWLRTFINGNKWLGFGFIESLAGRSWQQATIPWNTDTTTWLSHSKVEEAPQTLLLAQDGDCHIYDYVTSTDYSPNGPPTTIPWSVTSKDFQYPEYKSRLDGIYAKGKGNNVQVQLSFDEGNTWINYGTLNFGLTFSTQQVNGQYAGIDTVRWQLVGSDPLFELEWLRMDFWPETPW